MARLQDVLTAIDLSKKTFRRIWLNYFWTFCYNILMCHWQLVLCMPRCSGNCPPGRQEEPWHYHLSALSAPHCC